jgi:hypothetical protein
MKANIHDNYKPDPRINIIINFQRTMKFVIHNTVLVMLPAPQASLYTYCLDIHRTAGWLRHGLC